MNKSSIPKNIEGKTYVSTLTNKPAESRFALEIGSLVWWEEDELLTFRDVYGNHHEFQKVFFVESVWNDDEGVKSIPKPYIYDASNNIIDIGDRLLYGHVGNGENMYIVVFGSLHSLLLPNFDRALDVDVKDLEDIQINQYVRSNKNRYLQITEDAKGNIVLHVETRNEDEGNFVINVKGAAVSDGIYKQETNKRIYINQTDKDDKIINQLFMENKEGEERIKLIDKHKNVVETTKDGMLIKDTFGNFIKTTEDGVEIKDKNDNDVIMDGDGIKTTAKGTHKAIGESEHIIDTPDSKITGGKHTVKGTATPTGTGGFCAIPNCIFSGAPHIGETIQGT